ncbi:hypothetical protein [Nonomuraea sp. NPDC049709]|uniref:hypothetical protein n=1 Tax=Nonomuraea sp. NPDC049709 TaxID=3154736 RepID=UPI003419BA39
MTDQTTEDDGKQVRPFAAMLQEIQGGAVADQAATALQELVSAVNELGKKGEMTVKITVQPLKGNSQALNVSGDVTSKPPRPEPAAGVFFFDEDGNLLRDNPKQAAIPGVLREIKQAVNHDNIREV